MIRYVIGTAIASSATAIRTRVAKPAPRHRITVSSGNATAPALSANTKPIGIDSASAVAAARGSHIGRVTGSSHDRRPLGSGDSGRRSSRPMTRNTTIARQLSADTR